MEEPHQWMLTTYGGKEETTKAKEKEKAATQEARAKASTGVQDTKKRIRQRQQRKLQQRRIQQEQRKRLLRIQRIWIKQRLQRPRKLQQIKNNKRNNNYTTCHRCGKPGHWAQDCRVPVWHIGEGEELHPLEQEQADHDNNEELPQDVGCERHLGLVLRRRRRTTRGELHGGELERLRL